VPVVAKAYSDEQGEDGESGGGRLGKRMRAPAAAGFICERD
jgi:hypothetical protein